MKEFKRWIIYYIFFLLLISIFIFVTNWCTSTKDLILQYSILIVTGIGFILAIQQLKLSVEQYFEEKRREFENFLDLSINIVPKESFFSIKTQVFNKSTENKSIEFSFILINQQEQDIIEVVNKVFENVDSEKKVEYSNEFNELKDVIDKPMFFEESYGIIPLDFYFLENVQIGNESPSFTFSFNNDEYSLKKGIYTARFFIFPEEGYHRSTADNFIII